MGADIKDDLERAYERNSNRSEIFGYVLLAGLGLELLFAFILDKPALEKISTIAADLLIVGGVWGEIHFASKAREAGDGIVAEAKARAAEALLKAEQERHERVKLEARIAPRSLTKAQQGELAAVLAVFKGQKGTVRAAPSTPESEMFARWLAAPLREAGWDITPEQGWVLPRFLFPTGVIIEYAIALDALLPQPEKSAAADKLAELLNALEIPATAIPGMTLEPPNTIQITISTK